MATKRVWKKTPKGEEEILNRTQGLAWNLRRILILIDGESDEEKILQKGAVLPDNIPLGLQELQRQEYITAEADLTITAEADMTIADVKSELMRIARETLGSDAEQVIAKIKDAPDTKEGLQSVVSRCKKIVKMIIDEKKADKLFEKCGAVLNELS